MYEKICEAEKTIMTDKIYIVKSWDSFADFEKGIPPNAAFYETKREAKIIANRKGYHHVIFNGKRIIL